MAGMNPIKASFWRRHISRAERRGLSLRRYCADRDLPLSQAAYWAKRLAAKVPSTTAFLRVERAPEGPPALLRVCLPDGVTIEATATVAVAVIADLIGHLRAQS